MLPTLIARRGCSARAPENTLAALTAAVATAADAVHVDLRLTADRHVVALHDETVDATTDGTGRVDQLELAELRTLDAGSWFSPGYAGQRVPTLDQVITFAMSHPQLDLVIEPRGTWSGLEAALVVQPLVEARLTDRVVVRSSAPQTLAAFGAAAPEIRRTLVLHQADDAVLERCARLGIDAVSPPARLLAAHPGLVERARSVGLGVTVWAADDPEWTHVTDLGVDAILTACPDRLRSWLSAPRERHRPAAA